MRRPISLIALVMSLAACTHGGDASPPRDHARAQSGPVAVAPREGPPGVAFVASRAVYALPGRDKPLELAASVNDLLMARLAPAAILDERNDRLLYNSWRGRRPVIRAYDFATGDDRILVRRGYAFAVRTDGAVAFFEPPDVDLEDPRRYRGHVVVRRGDSVERWSSEAGRYVVAAWAGERLLAYRLGRGWPDLLVFDSAGASRVLARATALVAVSPDGRRAFVASYGARPAAVRVLDVASGREEARLEIDPRRVEWVAETGSWERDLVAAAASPGVLVFRVRRDAITLEQVLRFESPELPAVVTEPRLSPDRRAVTIAGETAARPRQGMPGAVVATCDRVTRVCVRGPVVQSPRLVYDPSRP